LSCRTTGARLWPLVWRVERLNSWFLAISLVKTDGLLTFNYSVKWPLVLHFPSQLHLLIACNMCCFVLPTYKLEIIFIFISVNQLLHYIPNGWGAHCLKLWIPLLMQVCGNLPIFQTLLWFLNKKVWDLVPTLISK